jgi:hypothetical protein
MFEEIGVDTVENSRWDLFWMESGPKGMFFHPIDHFHQPDHIGHRLLGMSFYPETEYDQKAK